MVGVGLPAMVGGGAVLLGINAGSKTVAAGASLNIFNAQKNAAASSGAGSGSGNRILTTSEAEEIWKINERFLDIETSSGRAIYSSHDPIKYIGGNSYYSKEIQYLINNGYRFIKEGDIWRAIR